MDSNNIFENIMNYSSTKTQKPPDEKVMKKSDKMLISIKNQGFNMEQLEDVIKVKGNQLIISIAGSGKTTALIFKIAYDIVSGEATRIAKVNGNDIRVLDKIWVCTFLHSGADELKSKLALWQRKLNLMDTTESMAFSTLHAEFKRALTGLGVTTNIIDSSVNSKNLKKVVNNYGITYGGKPLNSDMLKNLESALTYTRNRLDNKRYCRQIYDTLEIGPLIVDYILNEWKSMRRSLGCVDFEDLQELLYEECIVNNNLEVINYLSKRYSYIYVDEFQDTSQIQYALLKIYAMGAKKIVVIGDDDQTIYSWRGSYNKIITTEFAKDFNPAISSLSVNYRCPSTVLSAIKPSLENNIDRFKKELKSYNSGGQLRIGEFSNYYTMASKLSELVYEDVIANRSVAILCRVNSDGLLPALLLDRLGKFQYTISGGGMTLDSYIGESIINIAKLFTERSTKAVNSVLGQLTWDKYSVNNIMKTCKNNKVSFWEIPDKDLSYSCPEIANKLITWKSWRENLGDIKALKLIYQYFRTEVYSKNTQYNTVCKSVIIAVEALLKISRATCVEDFLEELDDINTRLKSRKRKPMGSRVRIATVHEFKGKEADSVYIWNDSEGVFPHSECDLTDIEELEEERRVHYIACTRARKSSTIMTKSGHSSMFLKEMDLSKAEVIYNNINGELKKSDKEKEVLNMLSDTNYFSKDSSSISKEIVAFILKEHKDNKEVEEIVESLAVCGYDDVDEDLVKDIIRDY